MIAGFEKNSVARVVTELRKSAHFAVPPQYSHRF